MGEWRECLLKELAVFQRGHDLPKTEMKSGTIPVAGSNGIIGYHDTATTKCPGITIGRSGNIGTPHFYKTDFWAHNTVLYVKDFNGNDEKYVFYFLNTIDFTGFNAGSAVPTLNRNHIHELLVKVPPLPEQKAIAEVLSSLDDKIDLLHQQNRTLEGMAEAVFRGWFVEPCGEGVPEGWEEGVVQDYSAHLKVSIQPQNYPQTEFYHYSIPSFDNNKQPVKEMGSEIQSNKYVLEKNCILFSKLNPHKDKRIWLLQEEVKANSICSTEFQVIKPIDIEHLYFLYGWLSLQQNYAEIASGVCGTSGSHQRIDPMAIFSYQCPMVPNKLIDKFNMQVIPLFKKIVINQEQIRTLTQLRDTLLPKLMTGEVRLACGG